MALQKQVPGANTLAFPELLKQLRAANGLDKSERDRLSSKHSLVDW
jgi:hypothetical protein